MQETWEMWPVLSHAGVAAHDGAGYDQELPVSLLLHYSLSRELPGSGFQVVWVEYFQMAG
jgi:hypothetical protein